MTAIEPGNLLDWGPEELFYSSTYRLPDNSAIERVSWNGEIPAGTWVRMQLRFSDAKDKLDYSSWTGPGVDDT